MTVAEITICVNFEDGKQAIFTVSPSGSLSPSQGDKARCSVYHWHTASNTLFQEYGFAPPHSSAFCRNSFHEIVWPWS